MNVIPSMEHLIETAGFPAACVIIMAVAIGISAVWVAKYVAKPLIISHLQLVTKLSQAHDDNSGRLDRLEDSVSEIAKTQAVQVEILRGLQPPFRRVHG